MQMPKYYEDEELVNLLDTYFKQDPNSKQYFSFLNLINDDCYRADFILKWFYNENEFWDNINNQIITDRFNAMNNNLDLIKSQPPSSPNKLTYMRNFVKAFPSYFGADYFIRKHILIIEDLKGLKGQKTISAFIKKHEKILEELENKYQTANTENTNQINTLIAEQTDTLKTHTINHNSVCNKYTTEFQALIENKTFEFQTIKNNYETIQKEKLTHLEELIKNYATLHADKKANLDNLEDTYLVKLKLKGPAEYFNTESNDYKKEAKNWLNRFYITFGVMILGLALSIIFKYPNFSTIVYLIDIFKIMPYITISTLSLLFLIFCGNRYLESKHLHNEMKQKSTLISAYLAIYKDLENNENTEVLISIKAKLLENIFSVSRYSKKGGMITHDAIELIKAINAK